MNLKIKLFINRVLLVEIAMICIACSGNTLSSVQKEEEAYNDFQEQLIEEGWHTPSSSYSGELPASLGVTAKYGQHDNYFDIEMGDGCDVVIKLINKKTDECIRYVYVPENSTITIQMIPQGEYYLKLAYGKDWMEYENEDGSVAGKFTDNASYEKSVDIFDFGPKNSAVIKSNILRINVKNKRLEHNFNTLGIDESEFFN